MCFDAVNTLSLGGNYVLQEGVHHTTFSAPDLPEGRLTSWHIEPRAMEELTDGFGEDR